MILHKVILLSFLAICLAATIPKEDLLTKVDVLNDELHNLQEEFSFYADNKNIENEEETSDEKRSDTQASIEFQQSKSDDSSISQSERCGFEKCSFTQDENAKKKWEKHLSNTVLLDHSDPRGTSMVASFAKDDSKNEYAVLVYDFIVKAQSQCGEFNYYMYNKEGCDVARFLVSLKCGSAEEETVFRRSASQNDFWRRVTFDIKQPVGTKCKLTFRASKGLSDSGKVYLDDVILHYQQCPREGEPDIAAHAFCRFDTKSKCYWSTSGDMEWKYNSWGTKTSNTGPNRYFGLYSSNGHGSYAYIDASSSDANFTSAVMTSPESLSPYQQCMRFFVNMYGVNTGKLEAFVITDGTKKRVLSKNGDQGRLWFEERISLPVNTIFNVELKATKGNGSASDIAIDEIKVEEGTCDQKTLTSCNYDSSASCSYKDDLCPNKTPELGPKYENLPQLTIEKSNLLTTLPRINEEWKLSFELFLREKPNRWRSVLHFTNGPNCCNEGNRVPAIFVRGGGTKLHICHGINRNNNHCIDSEDIPINKWVKVEMEQLKVEGRFEYNVKVDGKPATSTILNYIPKTYTNVKVYAGHDSTKAANGDLRNIRYENIAAHHKTCDSKCQASIGEATINGKKAKTITYDLLHCLNAKFHQELVVPKDSVRAPRQGCFRFNYRFGKSARPVTNCGINFYHRKMEGNNEKYKKHLMTLRGAYQKEWQTYSVDVDGFDEVYENRIGIVSMTLGLSCSYVSFSNMQLLDGPCIR